MELPRYKKSLGQHFLTRSETCAPLLEFLRAEHRLVVEIGPGSGVLTETLLASGATVLAWEIDLHWAAAVALRLRDRQLSVVAGDARQIPFERLPVGTLLTGNLPYNVSTAIILSCLESTLDDPRCVARAGFLVQREVAERLAASPGEPAYGSLSVLVTALARVELLGRVPPGAFNPPPKVESAFVGLTPLAAIGAREYGALKPLVRSAFSLRRKTLRNSLASELGRSTARRLIELCEMPAETRAESLDLEAFRRLAERLSELRS